MTCEHASGLLRNTPCKLTAIVDAGDMLCDTSDPAPNSHKDTPRTSVDHTREWNTDEWKATYMPEGSYFDSTADVELVVRSGGGGGVPHSSTPQ